VEYQAVALATLSMTLFYAAPLFVKSLMDRHLSANSIWRDVYLVGATLAMLAFLNASAPDFIYFQF